MPKVPFWVFILIAVIYFTAIRVDTMDIDASQYAEISREMMKSGDYLHIYDRGLDYLDKPPFLFWVSATSMKVFGVNNFGYKLPSVLFGLFALFATYKLAKRLYGEITGRMAALVLATCQGMFLMTNDIRCDTILMCCVITSVWLIYEWLLDKKWVYLLGGSIAIAAGMMTKGPIALMVPVFCFVCDWALKRQWQNFLQPAWLVALLVVAVLLIPMSIGLYQQFDLHPEKLVNGKQHTSGLRFFYWSQSFGRITGESPWKNDVDLSFLLLNMLWSFLPWIFLFIPAIIIKIIQLVRQKFRLHPGQEWLTTGGFLMGYLALGSSAYQLPHYIFVVFPLAAIVTARFLYELIEERKYGVLYRIFKPVYWAISVLVLLITLLLIVYVFPAHPMMIAIWVAAFAIWIYLSVTKKLTGKLFWMPAIAMIIINFFITNQIYFTLLNYQIGSQAGKYIQFNALASKDITLFRVEDPLNCIDFYANDTIHGSDSIKDVNGKKYIITMDKGLKALQENGVAVDILKQGQSYKVSELTPEFLNPATRKSTIKEYYILKVK